MAGKIAIVTGAGSGIGRAVAKALLDGGLQRRACRTPARAARGDGGRRGRSALVVPTDVTDPASVESLFAQTQEKFGRLDLLFNNAGTGAPPIPFDELTIEQWRAVVDVNLNGMFYCAREAVRHDEGAVAARRPHRQQRLDLGACAAPELRALHGDQARRDRPDEIALARRPAVRHRLPGRSTSATPRTEMTAKMKDGVLQANGTHRRRSRRWTCEHVAQAVLYMDSLPLDANVLFMTVMANKMPFVGRG